MSGHDENVEALSYIIYVCDSGESQTMSHLMTCVMHPIARGQTWLCQPLPVSTVPNTGRNRSNNKYRGLDEED